jgi:hypothetical protein
LHYQVVAKVRVGVALVSGRDAEAKAALREMMAFSLIGFIWNYSEPVEPTKMIIFTCSELWPTL